MKAAVIWIEQKVLPEQGPILRLTEWRTLLLLLQIHIGCRQ